QRCALWFFVVGVHTGRERRVAGAQQTGQRHHVHECSNDRGGGSFAVRRCQTDGDRTPRTAFLGGEYAMTDAPLEPIAPEPPRRSAVSAIARGLFEWAKSL